MSISIIDLFIILFLLLLFFCCIFVQNGIQLLIISELLWVFICCLFFCYGFFFDSIFFGCCAFFILILAALDASIWIFLLVSYRYFSNIENLFNKLPQIKFFLRARRLLYNNYFFN